MNTIWCKYIAQSVVCMACCYTFQHCCIHKHTNTHINILHMVVLITAVSYVAVTKNAKHFFFKPFLIRTQFAWAVPPGRSIILSPRLWLEGYLSKRMWWHSRQRPHTSSFSQHHHSWLYHPCIVFLVQAFSLLLLFLFFFSFSFAS